MCISADIKYMISNCAITYDFQLFNHNNKTVSQYWDSAFLNSLPWDDGGGGLLGDYPVKMSGTINIANIILFWAFVDMFIKPCMLS